MISFELKTHFCSISIGLKCGKEPCDYTLVFVRRGACLITLSAIRLFEELHCFVHDDILTMTKEKGSAILGFDIKIV